MSPTSAVGGNAVSTLEGVAKKSNGFSDISSEDFVKILVTELTQQDPLSPNDTQAVLEQLSSLRNIESQVDLQDKLEALVSQNQVAQASGMIGKVVEGLDGNDQKVGGQVVSVRVVDGAAVLELDTGKTLPMNRVTTITGTSAANAAALVAPLAA